MDSPNSASNVDNPRPSAAPDTRVAPQTDFSQSNTNVDITPDSTAGSYALRVVKVIRISGGDAVGKLLAIFPLDGTLEPVLANLFKAYERYSFDGLQLIIQTGSPLGTSSGSMQIAHFPDPENANFVMDGGQEALNKVVRQDGSAQIRPRDSATFRIRTNGTNYTLSSGSKRWDSFGAVVAVTRSVPDATDFVEFQITLVGTVNLYRTAIITGSDNVAIKSLITHAKVQAGNLKIGLANDLPAVRGVLHFDVPLMLKHRFDVDGTVVKKICRHTKLKCVIQDEEVLVEKETFAGEVFQLLSCIAGTTVVVSIPKLDYMPLFN